MFRFRRKALPFAYVRMYAPHRAGTYFIRNKAFLCKNAVCWPSTPNTALSMKIVIHPRYRHLDEFIRSLPVVFEHSGEVIRRGRNTIKKFYVKDVELVVKKYKTANPIQRLVYTWFRASKARRAYLFAARFRELNIATPHEVAYIEISRFGLFRTGYFISLTCNDEALSDVVTQTEHFDEKLADAFAGFMYALHSKGVLHGDTNITNVFCRQADEGEYIFTLIDINRTRFKVNPSRRDCLLNMVRIPHRVDFYGYVVCFYARLRGWDEAECVAFSFRRLCRMNRKRRLKRLFK